MIENGEGKKKVHAKLVRASFRAVRLKQKGEYRAAMNIVDTELKRLNKIRAVLKGRISRTRMIEKFGASLAVKAIDKCATCALLSAATEPAPKIESAVISYDANGNIEPKAMIVPVKVG